METQATNSGIFAFLFKNKFQILVIGAGLYIIFQKDMSFTINFNAPVQDKKEEQRETSEADEKEYYTTDVKSLAANTAGVEKFELPFFGEKSAAPDLMQILNAVSEEKQTAYLKRFAHVTVSERKKFGIPSSVILANALLHSAAGQSELADTYHNHFALRTDDGRSPQKFDSAWAGYRAHSICLTSERFSSLRELSPTDYRGWARGLERMVYVGEKNLAQNLLTLIDKYRLYELDEK